MARGRPRLGAGGSGVPPSYPMAQVGFTPATMKFHTGERGASPEAAGPSDSFKKAPIAQELLGYLPSPMCEIFKNVKISRREECGQPRSSWALSPLPCVKFSIFLKFHTGERGGSPRAPGLEIASKSSTAGTPYRGSGTPPTRSRGLGCAP